ncbi:MAG: hypothetical protein H6579_05120 [Chitinophagales bacterium]|nr:hypothetical protein [Chitinophagales bacterium]
MIKRFSNHIIPFLLLLFFLVSAWFIRSNNMYARDGLLENILAEDNSKTHFVDSLNVDLDKAQLVRILKVAHYLNAEIYLINKAENSSIYIDFKRDKENRTEFIFREEKGNYYLLKVKGYKNFLEILECLK